MHDKYDVLIIGGGPGDTLPPSVPANWGFVPY